MEQDPTSLIKHREVQFCILRPDDQAQAAALLLEGVDGVLYARAVSRHLLLVGYDVTQITLHVIDQALTELGFHLASNLLSKLKRALYYYTEETQRQNIGLGNADTSVQVFINRYQRIRHGCRDFRPEHWRRYQ